MLNDSLIINYDPFSQDSTVYISKEDGQKKSMTISSDISGLAEALIGLAYGQNIYSIKIRAPFAITNEISRQIIQTENTLYSENKIKVEGI